MTKIDMGDDNLGGQNSRIFLMETRLESDLVTEVFLGGSGSNWRTDFFYVNFLVWS
jgi:hypothetical protein